MPRIVCPPRAARSVLGVPQTVEQLVEAFLTVARISKILVSHRFLEKFLGAEKSAKIGPHSGSELLPESSPSTRAAHSDQFWEDESGGTWMLLPSGRWYLCSARTQKFSGMARDDGHGGRHWVRLLLRGHVASVVLASAYSLWSTFHTETMAASGRLGQALVMRQSTVAFESISSPLCSRCSHLESGAFSPCPCIWQSLFRVSGCC